MNIVYSLLMVLMQVFSEQFIGYAHKFPMHLGIVTGLVLLMF